MDVSEKYLIVFKSILEKIYTDISLHHLSISFIRSM